MVLEHRNLQGSCAKQEIVSTMSFCDESGKIIAGSKASVPGKWPDEITVIVDFRQSAGPTKVTVTEVGIPVIAYPLSKWGGPSS
jgi:hypothetical protein